MRSAGVIAFVSFRFEFSKITNLDVGLWHVLHVVYLFQLCFLCVLLFLKYAKNEESPFKIFRGRLTIKSISKEFTIDYFANYTYIKVRYTSGYDLTITKMTLGLYNCRISALSYRNITMRNKISVETQNMLNQIVYPLFCIFWCNLDSYFK